MSENRQTRARSNRQQQSESRTSCRTCQNCRRKKTKCDGQKPQCRACYSRALDCEYPLDARKSAARSVGQDFKSLQKEIAELKRHLQSGNGIVSDGEAPIVTNCRPDEHLAEPANNAISPLGQDEITNRPLSATRQQSCCSPEDNRPLFPLSGNKYARRSAFNAVSDETHTAQTQRDQDTEGIQVYGATSLLYDHSTQPFASYDSSTPRESPSERIATQDHLVSSAATHRQREAILCSSPSVMANVDFDGVSLDVAMHLINLHWRHQHLTYLITYRPAVMDSIFHNGPYANRLLLNALYLSSSLYSERINTSSHPMNDQNSHVSFYDRFKVLVGQHIDQPSIPTIVGLLIGGACLISHGKQRAGWIYCGIGYRMLIDLGCHLNIPADTKVATGCKLTATDVELRRRVFWGAYVGEKFQCLFLGRSPTLEQAGANISNEYLDTYEELEQWTPYVDDTTAISSRAPAYTGRPCYAISTFQSLLRLTVITSRVIHTLYSVNALNSSYEYLTHEAGDIRHELQQWRTLLPAHLQFDWMVDSTPPPHQLTPHTTYWTLVILVEQPFLDQNSPRQCTVEPSQSQSKRRCIEAAQNIYRILKAYREAFTLRRAQYGISYAAYCAVLALLRYTDEDSDEHLESIRFFWSALLEFQQGLSSGLQRPLKLLRSLMLRLQRVSQACGISPQDSRDQGVTLQHEHVHSRSFDEPQHLALVADRTSALDSTFNLDVDSWHNLWPERWDDSTELAEDSLFGFFMSV